MNVYTTLKISVVPVGLAYCKLKPYFGLKVKVTFWTLPLKLIAAVLLDTVQAKVEFASVVIVFTVPV